MVAPVYILEGARTPLGRFLGSLSAVTSTELGAIAAREAMRRSRIEPEWVNHVVFGNVIHSATDSAYLARHVGLKAGVPIETPALTVNRLCGSGLEALVISAQQILLGEADVVLAGGTENMSEVPYVARGARSGLRLGSAELGDYLWEALTDRYAGCSMADTAENLGAKYGVTRQASDEFALRSHRLASGAQRNGRLAEEIVPVTVTEKRVERAVEHDEHIRHDASAEGLAALKPRFREKGLVTAGNASGVVDGAAALVLASRRAVEEHGLEPLGRLVSWASAGVEPTLMGIGPAPASRRALEKAGLDLEQMDLIEVNEAFAPQYLAVEKELGLDRERVNVNGGAIALGHPLGATGARLVLTILHELRRRGGNLGLVTMCIGGGQGIAGVVECLQGGPAAAEGNGATAGR